MMPHYADGGTIRNETFRGVESEDGLQAGVNGSGSSCSSGSAASPALQSSSPPGLGAAAGHEKGALEVDAKARDVNSIEADALTSLSTNASCSRGNSVSQNLSRATSRESSLKFAKRRNNLEDTADTSWSPVAARNANSNVTTPQQSPPQLLQKKGPSPAYGAEKGADKHRAHAPFAALLSALKGKRRTAQKSGST